MSYKHLFIVVVVNLFILSASSSQKDINSSRKSLIIFNERLESLDLNLRAGDKLSTCEDSKEALTISQLNSFHFKSLEPYYKWEDINELLKTIAIEYC